MIASKSIRVATNYPQSPGGISSDQHSISYLGAKPHENSGIITPSMERSSHNFYKPPRTHVSPENMRKQQGNIEQVRKGKPFTFSHLKRNKSGDLKRNQIQNMKTNNQITETNKTLNFFVKDQDVSRNDSFQESFGVTLFNTKDILEKIDNITLNVEKMEKRLFKVQKFNIQKGLENIENQKGLSNSFRGGIDQNEKQLNEKVNKIREETKKIKEQMKCHIKWEDMTKFVEDKIKQRSEITKTSEDHGSVLSPSEQSISLIKKEFDSLSMEIYDKIKQTNEFALNLINKVDQQLKSNLNILSPSYRSSGIKCSGSAILLRFVESFKVRKNGMRKGEIKIVMTDNTYYIDHEGYLLDKYQNYLVNSHGNQIRLEEKHIKLLKEEEILQ